VSSLVLSASTIVCLSVQERLSESRWVIELDFPTDKQVVDEGPRMFCIS
jgi:hypothetical protein